MATTPSSTPFATDFLNSTSRFDTTPYWNPANMEAKWGITPPPTTTTTTQTGGNMPAFPWLAAATLGAAGIGAFGANRAQGSAREGAIENNRFNQRLQADMAIAGFGAQELAKDSEYRRQLRRGIDTLGLMNSSPYIANMGRQMGMQGMLAGQSRDRVAQANLMFGGFA